TMGDTEYSVNRTKGTVHIQVRSVKPIEVDKTPPAPPTETVDTTSLVRAVTGRVIERNGKTLPASMQVLLFASDKADRRNDKTAVPILVAKTDASGYFSGEVPNTGYDHAFAQVSGISSDLPVPLEKDRIPSRIILVIELPKTAAPPPQKSGDCDYKDTSLPPRTPTQTDIANAPGVYSSDLGTGRCVDFNTPNRAIEEFSFFNVVRTTEPEIRGYAVGDPTFGRRGGAVPPPPPGRNAGVGDGQPMMVVARNAMTAVGATNAPGGIRTVGTIAPVGATVARFGADTVQ